ncbi:hypothetical protein K9M74_00260 [Candidatus Woesearchaeota archaeon]|nr:hypothetical protein [Candidatus Woesearchaeota archaeon]
MKGRQVLLFVLLLFFLSGFASALEISSLEVTLGTSTYPLEHIALKHPIVASIHVNFSSDEAIQQVTADLSALSENPMISPSYKDVDFVCTSIKDNETDAILGAACTYSTVEIHMNSLAAQINFFVTLDDNSQELSSEITFLEDAQGPHISDIKTEFCEGTLCYLSSGSSTEVQIGVVNDIGTMHLNNIYYKTGNSGISKVFRCQDAICYGYYYDTCESGAPITFKLTSGGAGRPSGDDAGNPVTGVTETIFYCDEFSPGDVALPTELLTVDGEHRLPSEALQYREQQGVFVDVEHNKRLTNPVKSETIILWSLVTEDISGINAFVNTSELNNDNNLQQGTCEEITNGVFNCTWAITDIQPGDHQVYLYFTDNAGHPSKFLLSSGEKSSWLPITISVDDVVLADAGPTPKFFKDIVAKPLSAGGYNRVSLGLAQENGLDYPLYVEYTLQRSSIGGDIEAIHTFIDEADSYMCTITSADKEKVAQITPANFKFSLNPNSRVNEKSLLLIKINEEVNNLPDQFSLHCNMSVIVRQSQEKVYQEPAVFTIEIPLKLRNSALTGTPGKAFADKIIEQELAVEKWNTALGALDKITAELFKWCSYAQGLSQIEATGAGIEALGYTIELYDEPTGEAVAKGGSFVNSIGSEPLSVFDSLGMPPKVSQFLGIACEVGTCSNDELFKDVGLANGWFADGGDGVNTFLTDMASPASKKGFLSGVANDFSSELLDGVTVPSSQDSIVGAVMNKCLPGVIYNVNKYRTIECETLTCYKQASLYGVDVSTCDEGRSSSICMNVVGELYEAVPYTRIRDNLLENTGAMIEAGAPKMLQIVFDNAFCKKWANDDGLPENGLPDWKAAKIINVLACKIPKSLGDIMYQSEKSQNTFYYPPVTNTCNTASCNGDLETCGYDTSYFQTDTKKPLYYYWNLIETEPNEVQPHYKTKDISKTWEKYKEVQDEWAAIESKIKFDETEDGYKYDPTNPGLLYKDTPDGRATKKNLDFTPDMQRTYVFQDVLLNELYGASGYKTDDSNDQSFVDFKSALSTDGVKANLDDLKGGNLLISENLAGEIFQPRSTNDITDNYQSKISRLESDLARARQKVEEGGSPDDLAEVLNLEAELLDVVKEYEDAKKKPGLANKLSEEDKKIREERLNYMSDFAVNQAVSLLMRQGWLDWMKTSDWFEEDNGFVNVVNSISEYPDNEKQAICSGGYTAFQNQAVQGSALQCYDELCRPVLTQAVERTKFPALIDGKEEEMYLYTVVYYVGNVIPPNSEPTEDVIEYQVFFKKSGGDSEALFEPVDGKYRKLAYGDVAKFKQLVPHKEAFDELCISFKHAFPPGDGVLARKKEYCRDIVLADGGRESAFDTGAPVPKDYVQKALAEAQNEGSTTDGDSGFNLNKNFQFENYGDIQFNVGNN